MTNFCYMDQGIWINLDHDNRLTRPKKSLHFWLLILV
jgi:hypothetical protein